MTAIAGRLEVSLSRVSHRLRLLWAARPVRFERQGRCVFCSTAYDRVRCVLIDMADLMFERDPEDE